MTVRIVSRREVCEALKISRQRLHVLIAEGRIEETARGIDLEKAIESYNGTIDPARRAAWEGATVAAPEFSQHRRRRGPPVQTVDPDTGKPIDFSEARTRKEIAHAQRAQLEFAIRSGSYLLRDEVAAKEFAIARKLRDRLLGIPSRVANLVPPDAMAAIVDECEALVRELQDEIAIVAEGET